jgi:hypothetical protein
MTFRHTDDVLADVFRRIVEDSIDVDVEQYVDGTGDLHVEADILISEAEVRVISGVMQGLRQYGKHNETLTP